MTVLLLFPQIFSEKLQWEAEAKVDTGLQRRNEKMAVLESVNPYDTSKHEVAVDVEGSQNYVKSIQDFVREPCKESTEHECTLKGQEYNQDSLNPNDADTFTPKPPSFETPPPKPPRCKHKQWEIEHYRGNRENAEDGFVRRPEQSAEMKYLHEEVSEENTKDSSIIQKDAITILPLSLESIEEESLKVSDSSVPSEHVSTQPTDREEETDNIVQERIEAFDESESQASFSMSEKSSRETNSTAAKKLGIRSRIKGILLPKKNECSKMVPDKKGTRFRFSSTSKTINKEHSKVEQQIEPEHEEGEEILMAKYLGYVSPKLLKKSDKSNKVKANLEKQDAIIKPIYKEDKTDTMKEATEKLANLGYESPKLAKKSNDVVMTGAKMKRPERQTSHGRVKGLVKKMSEKFSHNETTKQVSPHAGKVTGEKCRKGISNRYKDKDIAVKGHLTGCYKINDDEIDSGEMFDYDMDSDVDTDEDREISYAEFRVNQEQKTGQQKPIQTTTYNYKLNERPTSPYHSFKQEMIESMQSECNLGSLENETVNADSASKQSSEILSVVHDEFGYSLVNKSKYNGNGSSFVEMSKDELMQLDNHGNVTARSSDPTRSRASDDDKELSLEAELRNVLASLGDGETRILKAPQKYEGTQLGSRPGTPKISVKPIRLKYEEEGRKLEYSRSFSSKDKGQQSEPFDRSQRCQSMIVKKTPQKQMMGGKRALIGRACTRQELDKEEKENIAARGGLKAGVGGMTEEHAAVKFDYRSSNQCLSCKLHVGSNILKASERNASNMITVGIGGIRHEHYTSTNLEMPLVASEIYKGLLPKNCHQKMFASNMQHLVNKLAYPM